MTCTSVRQTNCLAMWRTTTCARALEPVYFCCCFIFPSHCCNIFLYIYLSFHNNYKTILLSMLSQSWNLPLLSVQNYLSAKSLSMDFNVANKRRSKCWMSMTYISLQWSQDIPITKKKSHNHWHMWIVLAIFRKFLVIPIDAHSVCMHMLMPSFWKVFRLAAKRACNFYDFIVSRQFRSIFNLNEKLRDE